MKNTCRYKLSSVLCGIFAGLLECTISMPVLCLFSMLRLFSLMKCRTKRELFSAAFPFLAAYDLTKTSFLVSIYSIAGLPEIISVIAAVLAAVGAAALLFIPQQLCLSFFIPLKTGKSADAVIIALLFSFSEWLCENLGAASFPWLGVWAQAEGADFVFMTARLFGCRFTSFLILLADGLVYLAAKSISERRLRGASGRLLALASLSAFVFIYGNEQIKNLRAEAETSEKLTVSAVQLDCEGEEKNRLSPKKAALRYAEQIEKGIAESGVPDAVFLPETAVNTAYGKNAAAFKPLSGLAEKYGFVIYTGCFIHVSGQCFNTVIALTEDSSRAGEMRYCKTHLVPFGESSVDPSAEECRPIEAGGVRTACGICIESIYSDVFLPQIRSGAELVYIPANDSWFGKTFARKAHYIHSKMRAAETGRFTVRAANCGISAIIAPWCQETAKTESKSCQTITSEVSLMKSESVYSRLGDSFQLVPMVLIILSIMRDAEQKKNIRTQA